MTLPPHITQEQLDAVEAKCAVDDNVVRAAMSRIGPAWKLLERHAGGGAFLRGTLKAVFSVSRFDDGRVWLHVSVCGRKGRGEFYTPSFEELKRVKHDFIGEDKWAYQVFPSSKDYINHHPNVLHLYSLMDGTPALPDFTWGLGTI